MESTDTDSAGFGRLGLLYWKPVKGDLPAYWLEITVDLEQEGARVLRATIEPSWALQARTREGWEFLSEPVSGSDLVSLIKTYKIAKFPDVLTAHDERTLMDRPLPRDATTAAYADFCDARRGLDWLPDWTFWRARDGESGYGAESRKNVEVFDLISGRLFWDVSQDPGYWLELHAFGRPAETGGTVIRAEYYRSIDLARGEKNAVATFISRPLRETDLPLVVDHFSMTSIPHLASPVREEKSFRRALKNTQEQSDDLPLRRVNDGLDWLPPTLEFWRC